MTWHTELPGALPPDDEVLVDEEVVLPPEPRSVSVARNWVAKRLPDGTDEEIRSAIALLTSELVTNGVVHARTQLTLRVAVTAHDVLVGVHDLDLGHKEDPGVERHGGWGLTIVRASSAGSGQVQHVGGGKTAWFRVAV